jgi:NAD+ kinase
MTKYNKIGCVANLDSAKAQQAAQELKTKYNVITDYKKLHDVDVIVALGGDGLMLHTMHDFFEADIPIYGMNYGTVGFLMNQYTDEDLLSILERSELNSLRPLEMTAYTVDRKIYKRIAINEVSLLRQTSQAAHIKISVDGMTRISEMVCDGILIATSAGSTAYNLSVGGPVIPFGTPVLAMTPISPFRPRNWKGALLPHKSFISLDIIDQNKRPVSAVADFKEVRNITRVEIREHQGKSIKLLFDPNHSLEERIIREQFIN